ncbi:MAG: ATP-dependent Clp protease adaptor ClpS [Candidatus Chlorobium antarcticum]|nr:ATP-dependent Clp protease adaptor ClpS [Candidatus Chlorobium antarcticum]
METEPETKELASIPSTRTADPFRVVLFNDEEHSFDEVIFQIIKATRCSRAKAESLTWEVHNSGRSMVYSGPIEQCIRVSAVLEEIALRTEIQS